MLRTRGTHRAKAIGGWGGDARAEPSQQRERQRVLRHAHGNGVLSTGDIERHSLSARNDQREWARPEASGQARRDLGGDVDLVLDGGACEVGLESTIIDVSRGRAQLLRPGGVSVEAIEAELGGPLERNAEIVVRAPGQLASHYATRAELFVVSPVELESRAASLLARGARLGVLAPAGTAIPEVHASLFVARDPAGYARVLYESLRALDDQGVDVILVVAPATQGLGLAVADRLSRAAAPRSDTSSD